MFLCHIKGLFFQLSRLDGGDKNFKREGDSSWFDVQGPALQPLTVYYGVLGRGLIFNIIVFKK